MRICLLAVEIFAWGKYGGFGRAARTIGRELVQRGVEVTAVVPRRPGQRAYELLDGIEVHGFEPMRPASAIRMLRACDADVYHSCEPSLATWLALRAMPDRKHMVTCRDPRDLRDWGLELARPSLHRLQVALNFLYEANPWVTRAVSRADAVYTIGRHLIPKVQRLYRPRSAPQFLPTPIPIPPPPRKSETPVVCWIARLDRRKRPEAFLDLAEGHPAVRFVCAGRSRDPRWEQKLVDRARGIPNLELSGFLDQFGSTAHGKLLGASWIAVNCATRESMPNSMLEAAAHGCALLSHVDPDGMATRFGYHAAEHDFSRGLDWLLEHDRWRERGATAARYVGRTFATAHAMERHLEAYERLVGSSRSRRFMRTAAGG